MHRENTISEHLRDLLDVYPEVNVSGIGLFAIISKAAWIDVPNNELYPPTKTLSIRAESSNAVEFMAAVVAQMQDAKLGSKKLEEKLNSYITELKLTGSTRIEGIGSISRGTEHQLKLVDVNTQWGEGTAYLPVLEINPVAKSLKASESPLQEVSEEKSQVDHIQPVSYKELGKQSFLPLIVLCFGVTAFLCYFKGCDQNKLIDRMNVEEISKSEVVDAPNNLNSKYASYLSPEIIEQGCKIVVGSFQQRFNAESQLDEFSAAGYQIELSQNGDAYRVTIVFNCNDYNLKNYLYRVKEEVSSNAWYLSPDIKAEDL